MKSNPRLSYADAMRQANKEAQAACLGLVLVVFAWIILGFGIAQSNIVVLSTPLWIITGCIGTFFVAVAVAVVMARFVFKDVGLDEVEQLSCSPEDGPQCCQADAQKHTADPKKDVHTDAHV